MSAGAQVSGCRADDHWSVRQQAVWLRSAVAFRGPTADGSRSPHRDAAVEIHGAARPLCEPVVVHIEFWTRTATGAGTGMSSVMRRRLPFDGSRTRTVGFCAHLDDARTEILVAVYAGSPLAKDELPERLPDPVRSAEVRFRSERIGACRPFPAPDPTGCDAAGTTVSPSPSRSATSDIYHP